MADKSDERMPLRGEKGLSMNIVVYCGSGSGDDPRFEEAARDLGTWIAREGHTLVYGGSAIGLMGTVSRAALEEGGEVIGVEPTFFLDMGVEQHDLTQLIEVETMSERKAKMIELGDAFVALPGGMGTLEEISEIMSRIRLGLGPSECYLLNIGGYYDSLRAFLRDAYDHEFVNSPEFGRCFFPATVGEFVEVFARESFRAGVGAAPDLREHLASMDHCG